MALHQLTDLAVKKAKARDAEYLLGDGGGLFLRVLPSGAKTWQIIYTHDGRRRKLALGDAAAVPLSAARVRAREERARLADGADPRLAQLTREATQAAELAHREADAQPFSDMFDAWLLDGVVRKDGNAELRRTWDFNVTAKLASKPLKEVTEHDLRAVLRAIVTRGANRMAVRFCGDLRQMFRWAAKRQPWRRLMHEGNPAELLEISKIVAPDYDLHHARERVLSAEEVRELRDLLERMRADYQGAKNKRKARQPLERTSEIALWLCLSTACRIGELLMARWEHVDRVTGEWRIPKENVKGTKGKKQEHNVYLSDFALRQFNALHEITGNSEWCFPARLKEGHIAVTAVSKQVGDRQAMFKERNPLANRTSDNSLTLAGGRNGEWTPHDLRRTAATMMQALGVSLDVIDRCQNHVLAGSRVRRHYMHHDYVQETREAWCRLGAQLDLILAGR